MSTAATVVLVLILLLNVASTFLMFARALRSLEHTQSIPSTVENAAQLHVADMNWREVTLLAIALLVWHGVVALAGISYLLYA